VSFDPHARVADMDIEGIDVNMVLPSGGLAAFCSLDDPAVELAMYEADHRFLKDYCAPYPDRLTSIILVSARDVASSGAEVKRCGGENWPVGIFPICPPEMSLDDPEWDPIWAVAQDYDLTVIIHTFTLTARPACGTRGTACSCSAPPATRGTPSATWRRSSAPACWTGSRSCGKPPAQPRSSAGFAGAILPFPGGGIRGGRRGPLRR
jgi:hypothetical protein